MAAPTFVSVGNSGQLVGTTGSTLTLAYPPSLAAGDLIGAFFIGNCPTTNVPDVTLPANWTALADGIGGNNQCQIFVFIRDARAVGTETGNMPDFTVATPGTNGVVAGISFAFRNVATTSFTEQANTDVGTGVTITHDPVTTAGADRLVVAFVGVGNAQAPGSFTNETGGDLASVFSDSDTTGLDVGGSIQTATIATQSTTLQSGTITISSEDWATYIVALIPPAAVNITAEPTAGTVLIMGAAPTVSATSDATLSPTSGAIVAAGVAPAVTASSVIAATVGAIAIAGVAPTMSAGVAASPGAGAIAFVGAAPDIPQGLTERLTPNTVLAGGSNLQDTLTNSPPTRLADIDEPTGSDDTEWYTAVNSEADIDIRFGFPTSSGNLTGSQQLRVLIRGTSLPSRDVTLELWESGSKLTSEITEEVTSLTGQVVTLTFPASELADITGAGVELRVSAIAA